MTIETFSIARAVSIDTSTPTTHVFTGKMRVIPSKVRSSKEKAMEKPLEHSFIMPSELIKKPRRIKPRYSVYETSGWARLKRNPPSQPVSVPPKPLTKRVQARLDGNLDFLLENSSEKDAKQFRPPESYINLAANKRHAENSNLSAHSTSSLGEPIGNQNVVGDAKSNPGPTNEILELLKNGRTSRRQQMKKQPKIKPRHGIFGNSMFARITRNAPTQQPVDDVVASQPHVEMFVRKSSEMNSKQLRPTENLINSTQNERNACKLEFTEQILPDTAAPDDQFMFDAQPDDNQSILFGENSQFIDLTTPSAASDPIAMSTPYFEETVDSLDYRVPNGINKHPPTLLSSSNCANHDDPTAVFNEQSSPFALVNEQLDSTQNGAVMNESGWSNDRWEFNGVDGIVATSDSIQTHCSPSSHFKGDDDMWTSTADSVSVELKQQVSAIQALEHIRSKTKEKLLEVVRRLNINQIVLQTRDDFVDDTHTIADHTAELHSDCGYNLAENWQNDAGTSIDDNSDEFGYAVTEYVPEPVTECYARTTESATEGWPGVSYHLARQMVTTTYQESGGPAATLYQMTNNAFFQNNNVTIIQSRRTATVFRSSMANSYYNGMDHQFDVTDFNH